LQTKNIQQGKKQMKKNWKVVAIAAGVLIFSGCGQKADNSGGENKKNQEMSQEKNQGGVISSIKDAMGLGKTMRCTYRIQGGNGNMEMVSYVKGKSYMSETNVGGSVQKSIFNEDGMFSWSEKTRQGTKMSRKCMEELEKAAPEEEQSNSPQVPDADAEEAFSGATDVKCEEAEVDFSVPTDVNFVDQCEMMKKMMDSANEMKNRLPGGGPGAEGNIPNVPNFNVSQ
jgi:hypothetical protein